MTTLEKYFPLKNSLPHLSHWPNPATVLFQRRCCYVSVCCVIMTDCAEEMVKPEEQSVLHSWMLSDSCLPFNLATTLRRFLWDSLHLGFPTVLWWEGGFSLCSWEPGWSQSTGLLIVCLKISVKMAEWQEWNQNCCGFGGKVRLLCD